MIETAKQKCMQRLLFIFLLAVSLTVYAQKLKTVEGEYTYHASENVTLEQAKRTALDRAKIQALADVFGTIVSQYNATQVKNTNGHSSIDFTSIGGSEVKGEWIETIGEPEYKQPVYEDGMLVVSVKVKGRAREILSASIDYQARVLCNGIEDKFESDLFKNGDDFYLSFTSPVSGFLAVYLVDADNQAFCLLPYRNQTTGIYSIEANRHYLFFHEKSAPSEERSFVDEYIMTCERPSEHNQIYVIFSPNQFVKAVDGNLQDGLPRQLPFEDFNKWLVNCRKKDTSMTLRMIPIMIKK